MAASVNTSGSQIAVIDTEHELAEISIAGTYQLNVDTANMVADDILELRIYGKVRSIDTEREVYFATFADIQAQNQKASLPVVSPHHARFTLTQTNGTGRAFPWAIYAL